MWNCHSPPRRMTRLPCIAGQSKTGTENGDLARVSERGYLPTGFLDTRRLHGSDLAGRLGGSIPGPRLRGTGGHPQLGLRDAENILSIISLIHRRLDNAR